MTARRRREIRNSAELTQNRDVPKQLTTAEERAKAVRFVAGQARDAADLALLLDALDLTAEEAT